MEEVLLFVNPIAGRGRARDAAARIERRLREAGFEVRFFVEPAAQIEQDRLCRAPGARVAIVVGGDGTVRAVAERLINCVVESPHPTPLPQAGEGECRTPPLVVVPFGTANLMGRHLGLRWDDELVDRQVVHAIVHGSIRHLDAARANGRLFLLMAGVGIDAHIVHLLDRMRSGPIDVTSYLLPTILALRSYQFSELTVRVDGNCVFHRQSGVAFVGNAAEYGTGFPILPHARSDDDLLDVCVIPCQTRDDMLRMFLHAAAGEHLDAEGVVYLKGRSIRIESNQPVPVQLDGEAAGYTPLDIDLLPIKVPFIVPH